MAGQLSRARDNKMANKNKKITIQKRYLSIHNLVSNFSPKTFPVELESRTGISVVIKVFNQYKLYSIFTPERCR